MLSRLFLADARGCLRWWLETVSAVIFFFLSYRLPIEVLLGVKSVRAEAHSVADVSNHPVREYF